MKLKTLSQKLCLLTTDTMKRFKKVYTEKQILADPRIEQFIKNYDGYGKHMVSCKMGYVFEGERTIDIGNLKDICYCINTWLNKDERFINQ